MKQKWHTFEVINHHVDGTQRRYSFSNQFAKCLANGVEFFNRIKLNVGYKSDR